jgi:hypothetical protein
MTAKTLRQHLKQSQITQDELRGMLIASTGKTIHVSQVSEWLNGVHRWPVWAVRLVLEYLQRQKKMPARGYKGAFLVVDWMNMTREEIDEAESD